MAPKLSDHTKDHLAAAIRNRFPDEEHLGCEEIEAIVSLLEESLNYLQPEPPEHRVLAKEKATLTTRAKDHCIEGLSEAKAFASAFLLRQAWQTTFVEVQRREVFVGPWQKVVS